MNTAVNIHRSVTVQNVALLIVQSHCLVNYAQYVCTIHRKRSVKISDISRSSNEAGGDTARFAGLFRKQNAIRNPRKWNTDEL